MKKTITSLLIPVLITCSLHAQQISGIAVFTKVGYTSLARTASVLNNISPPGSGFTNNFIIGGGEGYYRDNNNIVALDAHIGIQKAKPEKDNRAKALSAAGYIKFGRIVIDKKQYWLYPSLGFGVAAIGINTYNNENDEVTNLKDKLHSSPSMDLGFNTDYIVNKLKGRDCYSALLLGLRTGYRISIKNKRWKDNGGNNLSDMPCYAYKGFYVMVTIGTGVFVK